MAALHDTSKSVYLIDFIQGLPCPFFFLRPAIDPDFPFLMSAPDRTAHHNVIL